MKTVAIVLVAAIAGYAILDLFKGNNLLSTIGKQPGTIAGVQTSIPGYPSYPSAGTQPSNSAGTAIADATAIAGFAAAFGPDENQGDDSSEDDIDWSN